MISVTLRLREADTPKELRTIAAWTPTPLLDQAAAAAGKRIPPAPDPTSAESLVRQQVGAAVSRLSYDQVAGPNGKDLLRQSVRDAANQMLPGQPVEDVYLREYLVK